MSIFEKLSKNMEYAILNISKLLRITINYLPNKNPKIMFYFKSFHTIEFFGMLFFVKSDHLVIFIHIK